MRTLFIATAAAFLFSGGSGPAWSEEPPPAWAYPVNPPGFKPEPDDGTLRAVPASPVTMTLSQTRDRFSAPDWRPLERPAMPEVVARGRKPNVYACGYCHRADGPGGPENANLTGLSKDYIVEQMRALRSGERRSAVPKRTPIDMKTTLVADVSDAELEAAAAYFASIPARSMVKVVESDTVPKVRVAGWVHVPEAGAEREPIGERIVEIPDEPLRFELRDPRATFTAFVPPGALRRGKTLAESRGAPARACASCHGPGLKGVGTVPLIAGRSPSYLARQLYDIKHGYRNGAASATMRPVLENLGNADILALAAYVAAQKP